MKDNYNRSNKSLINTTIGMKTLLLILFFTSSPMMANTSFETIMKVDTILSDKSVTYKINEDTNNFYLNINTSDRAAMMSMVRLGVTVYFDIKGKKKKNVYVKYPSEALTRSSGRPVRKRNDSRERQHDEQENSKVKEILENKYSQKAQYSHFEDSQEFNVLLNNIGIEVSMTYDEDTRSLNYDLTIPKALINTNPKKDLSKLSIGFETSNEKNNPVDGGRLNGSIGGMNIGSGGQQARGQGRGGMSGGRGGRGGGNARGGQGGERNSETRSEEILLDYWFDTRG